jgi:hypothetical protein
MNAPRRTHASARSAGTRFERIVADYLATRLRDDRIDRRAKTGAKDRGDIGGVRTPLGGRVVIECKDTTRLDLPGWLREAEVERGNDDAVAGVVVHKKRGTADPADQYVTMSLETLAVLIEGGARA